jgi:hypothetical protein
MPMYHERLLKQMSQERERLMSRRRVMAAGGITLGGALALGVTARGSLGFTPAFAQDDESPFESDIDVLNYALTLEHLETAFYRDGVGQFEFGEDELGNDIADLLSEIGAHEQAHVDTLVQVITDLGGTPVEEAEYDFGYDDAESFLMTAAALENTGVMAYDGAGQFISDPGLLTAAGTIVGVEARHAAYLNLLTGEEPYPDAFEQAKTPEEILEIAGPFIVS